MRAGSWVANGHAGAFFQFTMGRMDMGVLCSLINVCMFGGTGLVLQYLYLYSLCVVFLHWLIVDIILRWNLGVGTSCTSVGLLVYIKSLIFI